MKKPGLISALLGIVAICLCLSGTSFAAQDNLNEAVLVKELSSLSAAIDRLAQNMTKQAGKEQQDTKLRKLDIAVAYLNFRSRRIEMFERDLQSLRNNRNRLSDVQEQLHREEESLSRVFDVNQRDAMQRAHEELSFRRQAIKDRISRSDEEIIILENRMMDMQSQIDSVESFVQKNLEF